MSTRIPSIICQAAIPGLVALALACSSSGGGSGSQAASDAGSGEIAPAPDSVQTDSQSGDSSAAMGFEIRKPRTHHFKCPKEISPVIEEIDMADQDWLCTFAWKGDSGRVYAQATPVACKSTGMSVSAEFMTKAWLEQPGKIEALSAVFYDWGGNHNNDALEFTWQGQAFKYYHSSFGFGWRKCQPMDCLQVLAGTNGKVVEDGCTKERTLPIACVPVKEDGTTDPLVDSFKPCPGDPNYP
jgi:hypothetical protein